MTTQLLIYQSAVPVTQAAHAEYAIDTSAGFSFAATVNAAPLTAVEFPAAAAEFPIVFGGTGTEIAPAAVLGLRDHQNLFVRPDGTWNGTHVPAFLRRYPFVLSQAEGERFLVCVDETWQGVNREGRGEPLFGADGMPSAYMEQVVTFLREYQGQFAVTHAISARIEELGLLEPMQADVTLADGGRMSLSGFSVVNRQKLKSLTGAILGELAASDALELIYLHLQSLRNFDSLRTRV